MTKSFSDLRKNSQKFDNLAKTLKKDKKDFTDARFWKYSLDKAGNAEAVIRFLPATLGDDWPFVKIYEHNFKGPTGQWYIEKSLTSIDPELDDPVKDFNAKMWNSGNPKDREIVSGIPGKPGTKRKVRYISNILVIDDPANPDNNGKQFLFSYGELIYEFISSAMNPTFKTEKAYNPFDFWEGRNFNLRVYKKDNYAKYDKCGFDGSASVAGGLDDKALEAIWKTQEPLKQFIDITNTKEYKPYAKLKARFDLVMGTKGNAATEGKTVEDETDNNPFDTPGLRGTEVTKLPEPEQSVDELMESLPTEGDAGESFADLAALIDKS